MAIPGNQGKGDRSVKERLVDFIRRWKNIEVGDFATLEEAEQVKRDLQHDINVILQRHPKLGEVAVNHGYDDIPLKAQQAMDGSDPADKPGGPDRSGAPDETDQPDNDGNKGGGVKGGQGGGGGGGNNGRNDRLPAGTQLVRGPGGKIYVVTEIKYKGKTYRERWVLPDELKKHYGVKERGVKDLTKAQLKRIPHNGLWKSSYGVGGRHPSAVWREEMAETFNVAPGMLRNRGVMSILIEAQHEKRDGAWILRNLKTSKWAENKTSRRLDWILNKSDADREDEITRTYQQLKRAASEMFGEVDFTQHFSDERLRQMAENAASGKKGWDAESAMLRITKRAEKTPGTAAAISREESMPNSKLDIEDMSRGLREEFASWAGWGNVPSNDTFQKWAADILNKKRSDADFQNWASQTAHGLHKWLGPNERFQDTQDVFKQKLETLLGTTAGYDDPLLQDLSHRDPDGKPAADQRISLYDFERMVRQDDRFTSSQTFQDEGDAALSYILDKWGAA